MFSPNTGEKSKRDRPAATPSPNSHSPPNKKLNFEMAPKVKILRSKPELEGKGDNLLRKLHEDHFYNKEENFPPAETYLAKQC